MTEHKRTGKIERLQHFGKETTVLTQNLMYDHLSAVYELFQGERDAKICPDECDGQFIETLRWQQQTFQHGF